MAAEPLRIEPRECPSCGTWTQCGRCPDCGVPLGAPPYALPVRPEELDFAPAPTVGGRIFCPDCGLRLPFHQETCSSIRRRAEGRP